MIVGCKQSSAKRKAEARSTDRRCEGAEGGRHCSRLHRHYPTRGTSRDLFQHVFRREREMKIQQRSKVGASEPAPMSCMTILGSGRYLPGRAMPNQALARIMDTSADWIQQRTGIEQRHFAPDGVGASDLAVPAARAALEAAGVHAEQVDYIIFNTMTPDYVFPGSGALLGAKLGMPGVPALDLRQQCAAIPFSLQLANALIVSAAARYILIVGAEAHAGFMPWNDWSLLAHEVDGRADERDYERATQHRGMSILFGDGAGALLLGPARGPGSGWIGAKVHSDGRLHDALRIEAAGFRRRPFIDAEMLANDEHVPRMMGATSSGARSSGFRKSCGSCVRRTEPRWMQSTGSSHTRPTTASTPLWVKHWACRLTSSRPISGAMATPRVPRYRS